jgi:hypothetical protein
MLVRRSLSEGDGELITGAPDSSNGAWPMQSSRKPRSPRANLVDLTGQLNLRELAAVIRSSDIRRPRLGAMHIAAAPPVTLFGRCGNSVGLGRCRTNHHRMISRRPCRLTPRADIRMSHHTSRRTVSRRGVIDATDASHSGIAVDHAAAIILQRFALWRPSVLSKAH